MMGRISYMFGGGEEGPICEKCNRRVIKLVALYDNGQGPKMCQDCKRCIRNQIPIVRFNRQDIAKNLGEAKA